MLKKPVTPTHPQESRLLQLASLAGEKDREIKALVAQVTEAQQNLQNTLNDLEKAQVRLSGINHDIELADESLLARKADLEDLKNEALSLESHNDITRKQGAELTEQKKALEQEVHSYSDAIKTLIIESQLAKENEAKRAEQAQKEHAELVNDLQHRQAVERRELTRVLSETDEAKKVLAGIQNSISLAKKALETTTDQQNNVIKSAHADLAAINATLALIETQLGAAKENKRIIERDTTSLRAEKDDLIQQIAVLKADFTEAKKQVDIKRTEIDGYKTKALVEISDILKRAKIKTATDTLVSTIKSVQES